MIKVTLLSNKSQFCTALPSHNCTTYDIFLVVKKVTNVQILETIHLQALCASAKYKKHKCKLTKPPKTTNSLL